MLRVHSPIGNIFHDEEFANMKEGTYEVLKASRVELEKRILRRRTEQGTDIGLSLNNGIKLHHGDVIRSEEHIVVIKQLPDKVITVKMKNKEKKDVGILLGHIIGNRHRPISIHNDEVSFPVLADSELEVFSKLFSEIMDSIYIKIEEKIFVPHSGADVHEH